MVTKGLGKVVCGRFQSELAAGVGLLLALLVVQPAGFAGEPGPPKDPEEKHLAREFSILAHDSFTAGNNLRLLVDGPEFFPVRKNLIRLATRTIDIAMFLWCDDEAGLELARLLAKKASHGVRVRVIVSYYNIAEHEKVYRILRGAGVEVIEHNPVYWGLTKVFEHSAHEKIMVVDGEVGLIGGVNLCDEYMIGGSRRLWHDMDVQIQGPQIERIQAQFDENWNWMALRDSQARFAASKRLADSALIPVYKRVARTYAEKTPTNPAVAGEDESLFIFPKAYRTPQVGEDALKLHVLLVETAKKRIRLMTPYLVPPRELREALGRAAQRGVQVEVLTNSPTVNDAWPARFAALPHAESLIQSGVLVYEYFVRTLHGKGMLIDNDLLSIGSHNFTNRSFRYNGESSLLTTSGGVISRFQAVFDADVAGADPLLEGEAQKRIRTWKEAGMALISDFLEHQI